MSSAVEAPAATSDWALGGGPTRSEWPLTRPSTPAVEEGGEAFDGLAVGLVGVGRVGVLEHGPKRPQIGCGKRS